MRNKPAAHALHIAPGLPIVPASCDAGPLRWARRSQCLCARAIDPRVRSDLSGKVAADKVQSDL
jgi:hypothetical protein